LNGIQMDYCKIYQNLVLKGKERFPTPGIYYENHHIIPKCMGGTDEEHNLVCLTPEEHYLAHQLLVKIYPNEEKLTYAAFMMTVGNTRNNKLYGWVKRARFSKPMPIDTRQKISKAAKNQKRQPHTEETKIKMRVPNQSKGRKGSKNSFFGKTHSHETRKKLSEKCGVVHKGKPKSENTKKRMAESFTVERRSLLSQQRSERNRNLSESHKQATRESNINRGINKQREKILQNMEMYSIIFLDISNNLDAKSISKLRGFDYHLVWKIINKWDYFWSIYQQVCNEQQK